MKNGKFSIGRFMRKNVILLLLIAMIIVFSHCTAEVLYGHESDEYL